MILVPFPTEWDLREFDARAAPDPARDAVRLLEPRDADVRADFDVERFVRATRDEARGRARGVFASSDYPGAQAAALLARELGLPGPDPRAVLAASHKFCARTVQAAALPEAVPRFALLDPFDRATWDTGLGFPCFVKPVKGSFSVFARRVDSRAELEAMLSAPELREYCEYFVSIFDGLVRRHGVFERGARLFLAEELLAGRQVTCEGWVERGEVRFLGVVDTHFHPGTQSFARFEHPSDLAPATLARVRDVAARAVRASGLDQTLFNLELRVDEASGRVAIVELNPRMCGQFADLYAKVDGQNGYAVARALACGERVGSAPGGQHALAASVPLRCFARSIVRRVPDAALVRAVERAFPGTRVWIECAPGDELLRTRDVEDGWSQRYGVVNLGAASRAELLAKLAEVERALGIVLEPVG